MKTTRVIEACIFQLYTINLHYIQEGKKILKIAYVLSKRMLGISIFHKLP